MSEQPEFMFRHRVDVRFSDIDVGAHAHHSRAVLYFEEARMAYWAQITGRTGLASVDFVVAELNIRFHERVLWPQALDVGVWVSKLGKRHFEMDYEVRSNEGVVLVSGTTVQVMFDFEGGSAKKMPPEVRKAIDAFDGPFGPGGRRVAVAGS